ncbi:MAG: DNA mismatch repair protein MutS [Kiritimatiellia bacterium]|jgi:DNA mismatch repair protein MutS
MSDESTPMMRQYRQIRNKLPEDTILFFRLGDFYEMFFDDAKTAAAILDIALTKRHKVPMCGVPYHSAQGYLAKLIRAGVKVAICEQIEDPSESKGIVKRDITRIITPGTVLEEQVLESNRNNFLAGLHQKDGRFGLAMLDLSTGEFWMEEAEDASAVMDNLVRYAPAECIVPDDDDGAEAYAEIFHEGTETLLTPHDEWTFESDAAYDILIRHFKVHSLEGFGCETRRAGIGAAGAVLHYVKNQLRNEVEHIFQIRLKNPDDFMQLDESTIANLELVQGQNPLMKGKAPTLLNLLNTTQTAMGGRLLREWILRPRTVLAEIEERHDAIEALLSDRAQFKDLREKLGDIKDLERLIARMNTGSGNARDLQAIAQSLGALPAVKAAAEKIGATRLRTLSEAINPLPDICTLIRDAVSDEPPITIKDGGLLNSGYHEELDALRKAASEGRQWLAEFQTREQERTGIRNLKIRHNKVFGYYIEISKAHLALVPEEYTRKQTLVNAERFVTPGLKEYENKILGAQERSEELEYELFLEIRAKVTAQTRAIQITAIAIAELDVLASLGERALTLHYTRPVMNEESGIHVIDGRHPVIENLADTERFVPNDTKLDGLENQLILITGPNMAGKSTYIRQVALMVILAQIGSYVPAKSCTIGIVDRVFTRVGASDDLARGRSTFMVEMQETANILNNATPKSLIVLDEIGRGTSTFDGISIAWAVAEHLHNNPAVKAKTLFATHYHELTELERTLPGVKNYSVLVKESGDRIRFMRKIVPGPADKSYGIQVGRLAGLPDPVVDRANEILKNLEEGELNEAGLPQLAKKRPKKRKTDEDQMSLFG